MPWFVPPADIHPAPAATSVPSSLGLTSFVPHPRRLPNPASSSRPDTEYTVFTSTVNGRTETFIGPPAVSGPDLLSPAVTEDIRQARAPAPVSLSAHPKPGLRFLILVHSPSLMMLYAPSLTPTLILTL
eukprot:s4027_g2.t1